MVSVIETLNLLKEEGYKKFASTLVSTKYEILGVRVPALRKLAASLSESEVNSLTFKTFEEVFLYGASLGKVNDVEVLKQKLNFFLPYIDNWSICDMTVASLKIIKKNKDKLFNYFVSLLKSGNTYYMRFAIVVFLTCYKEKCEIEKVLNLFPINNSEYYFTMAVAWLNATYLLYHRDFVLSKLNLSTFSKFVINKTISKANDSFRVSKSEKEILKGYRV